MDLSETQSMEKVEKRETENFVTKNLSHDDIPETRDVASPSPFQNILLPVPSISFPI